VVNLESYLILSAILFAIGLYGALVRRNAVIVLIAIEIMMNAANLNFIAFARYIPAGPLTGQLFVLFGITIAAAEVAVGLALVIAIFRFFRTVEVDRFEKLKG
jgi:NADH-quinone oxidoreductase subunit K